MPGFSCNTDAKSLDCQAGMETGMGATLAAVAGINVVAGPGMIDLQTGFSIEKLVVDNELCGQLDRLLKGNKKNEELDTIQILTDYEKKKQLVSHPSTRKNYRKECYIPPTVIERGNRQESRVEFAALQNRAADRIKKLLAKEANLPPQGIVDRLTTIIKGA